MNPEAERRHIPAARCAALLLALALTSLALLLWMGPIPQDPAYHQFADTRTWLGIPHAGDVLTNLGFLWAGTAGLLFLARAQRSAAAFATLREKDAYSVFLLGVLLTAAGSAWYHLQPDTPRLFWDRLPMSLGFMGIFSALLSERISLRAGIVLLFPLVIAGAASVTWWAWTEQQGAGDLRWYGLAQFYPMAAMLLLLLLRPSRYTRGADYLAVLLWYSLAKVAELLDADILAATGFLRGHNLKHLLAAAAAWWVLRMLKLRRPALAHP